MYFYIILSVYLQMTTDSLNILIMCMYVFPERFVIKFRYYM